MNWQSWPLNLKQQTIILNWVCYKFLFFIFITIYAGIALCLFPLNLAHTNDFVPKEKFVAAGGGLQLVFGLGAIGGPLLCSIAMEKLGPNGYFAYLLIFHIIIALFGIVVSAFSQIWRYF